VEEGKMPGMIDRRQALLQLLKTAQVPLPSNREETLQRFLQNEENGQIIDRIIQQQDVLMTKWKLEDRIAGITEQPVRIPNATVGKPYEVVLDFEKLGWQDITASEFAGLEELGLAFDKEQRRLSGTPLQSGDRSLQFRFKVEGQPAEAPFTEKAIPIIINPDPRSLWKNLESNKEDPYWKEDDVTVFAPLGDRHILVSSERGRSHANVGSFREDDFAFSELENGWSLVAVSDGAGSASHSRKGSAIACAETVAYFKDAAAVAGISEIDPLLEQYKTGDREEAQKALNRFAYTNLGKAAYHVHKKLHEFAKENSLTMKELSATLVFVLIKKYKEGYVLLSFGVGDCPMAVLNKDLSEVSLLNWIDVGEFSGGTRFITMPEIFGNEKFPTRFGFKLVDDFSYLVLMSDGIYDPKFSVEAALEDVKNWQNFFADLRGQNPEKAGVELSVENKEITAQLSRWMDFWSPGNHDDRTLAIVF
jgi:serine/threonine protein phosphatase PrpC